MRKDDKYISKMPKVMLLMHIQELMTLIKDIHKAAIQGDTEKIQDMLIDPMNMMHLLVAKILLSDIATCPDEKELLEQEMEQYEAYHKDDIDDTNSFIAGAELDVLLNKLGIKRDDDARDLN